MNIGLLEKSEHMKPLLVKLYDTHRVYKSGGKKASAARTKLGDVVTELLDVSVGQRERDLVTDMLLALIQKAEAELRTSLAKKLAKMENVPSRLILNLAYDEIKVADSILRHSPVLSVLDLMYIIQSRKSIYWQAIASRQSLPDSVVDELISLEDKETDRVLAGNECIEFSEVALEGLFESAKRSDNVAQPLLERSDIPKSLVKKLYHSVGENLKLFIQDKYGSVGEPFMRAVDEVIEENVGRGAYLSPYLPSENLLSSEYAKSQIRTGRSSESQSVILQEMHSTLKLKRYKLFVAQFTIFMSISAEDSIVVLSQEYGHGLAILCKAHSIERNDFIKLFLLTEPIRSNEHVMKGITLNRALSYYDRLNIDLARDLYKKNFESLH